MLFPKLLCSQEVPPIEVYLPKDYKGETQNWDISQSDNKYIYVANNSGLLEFNGTRWTLYPTPNGTIMRSVNVVNDRIYTGFYMNFGFWKKNNLGKLEYTSLSDTMKKDLIEDEQFWFIVNLDNWILFQSLNRIYIYNEDTGEINIIESEVGMLTMYNVNGTVYYQDIEKGIFKIEQGKPKLVTDFSIARNDKIVNISETDNGILILTDNHGFFEFSNNTIRKWKTPADDLFETIKIIESIRLKDKSFVLGTISKGLIHLSPTGEIIDQIEKSKGLSNNTVLTLFEDIDENIWMGLDNGINKIEINSPIQIFNDRKGNLGTVYASIVYDDFLYLGTNQGLFYKKLHEDGEFTPVKGTDGQVWSLFVYDNTLFCGHNFGTFLIQNNEAKLISDIEGGWTFKTIPENPNWLLQGTYTGLSILEKKNNNWNLKHKIKGFDYSARFAERYDNGIWVNHEYKGIFKIKVDKHLTNANEVTKDSSVAIGKSSRLTKFNDHIWYTHENGVFSYNSAKKAFERENVFGNQPDSIYHKPGKLIEDNVGGLWNFTEEDIGYVSQGQFSEELKIVKIPISRSLRKEMVGFENIIHIKDDNYLLGTTNGYMIVDISKMNFNKQSIILDRVAVRDKYSEIKEVPFSNESPSFSPNLNTISFAYTIPEYNKFIISRFQYKLEGFYDNWSEWTTKPSIVFENLPFGEYTFMVRAKTGNNLSENVIKYPFTIERPWYVSILAIILYSLSFLIILLLMHRAYKRYYTKQKQKLLEENRKQLELKQLESEREIMKLNNEKLTQDIESKNRELASSTMNIIKKNEILNTIKKELQRSGAETDGLKNVERIIDRNLNNKDDWKHFEEAFNSVDKDFLKKIKARHNDLTPHDLRFCTYLRLNLSSKEIAPLLNISVRSVEIKRYRLRKKLKLEHSESLVNYILEI